MHRSHQTPDSVDNGFGNQSEEDGWIEDNSTQSCSTVPGRIAPVAPLSPRDLQLKFYMRSVALGRALEFANSMPSFTERRLLDIVEMLKWVNNVVHLMEPNADLGYDLPVEIMDILVGKLPSFFQMSWKELVKRGEGSPNDVRRLREWLVKKATDKMVETIDLLEKNGFDVESVFKNVSNYS
uniref:DNA replication and repair protein recF n=1 Tax=Lygus hesperus TaxID=30085 RepID=A0A0A9Z5V5_LYGHE